MYLVVEGKVERDYFTKINSINMFPNIQLEITIGNIKEFKTIYKSNLDNPVFFVFDLDNHSKHSKEHTEFINLTREYKGCIIYSRFSFETFLLNHKLFFNQSITQKSQYDSLIRNYFSIDHWGEEKNLRNRQTLINQINVENVKTAIDNCKKIEKSIVDEKKTERNPYTNMHILFKELDKISKK